MSAVETITNAGATVAGFQDCACPIPTAATVKAEAVTSVNGVDKPTVLHDECDCACPTPVKAVTEAVGAAPVAGNATIEVAVTVPTA